MPALLFLLHRCRVRLDLFARADLVSIPPAVLLQWAQLACPKTHRRRDRLYACRQRLCAHRRLAAGADVGRSALARRAAPHPRSLCQAVLSGVRRRDYIKSHGRTVKDIMTRDVVAVTEDTDLGDVAALLEAKRIKRVP